MATSNWTVQKEPNETISLDADNISRICYPIIGITGILGNSLVIVVMATSKNLLKSVTNILILNQSALDFIASLLVIASTFIRDINENASTFAKELFCRVWLTNLFVWGIFVSSTYNLLAITLERYITIVYPLNFTIKITRRKAYVIISGVWIFGPAYNAAFMVDTAGLTPKGDCTVYSEWPDLLTQRAVGIFTIFLQFFIPLIVIIIAYVRIILTLKKSVEGAHSLREQRITKARKNVVKTLLIVATCFVACWISNQIYFLLFNCGYNRIDFNGTFYHFTVMAVFCNCCINPIVYFLQYDQFRIAAKNFFMCQKGTLRFDVDCCHGNHTRDQAVFYLPNQATESVPMSNSFGSEVYRKL